MQAPVRGTAHEIDFEPVVRIEDGEEDRVWLLTEIDPDHPGKAWGLCLNDPTCPEPYIGSADLGELAAVQEAGFLTVRPIPAPEGPVSHYLFRAQARGALDL